MANYNEMPEPAIRITDKSMIGRLYDTMQDFFTYCWEETESRQPFYEKDNIYSGTFNLRIFWIRKEKGLGYGIAQDYKTKTIEIYRFGTAENWQILRNEFCAVMRHDNS